MEGGKLRKRGIKVTYLCKLNIRTHSPNLWLSLVSNYIETLKLSVLNTRQFRLATLPCSWLEWLVLLFVLFVAVFIRVVSPCIHTDGATLCLAWHNGHITWPERGFLWYIVRPPLHPGWLHDVDTVGYRGRRAVSVGPEDRVSDAQLDGEVSGRQGLREEGQHLLLPVPEDRLPVVRSSGSWSCLFQVPAAYRPTASNSSPLASCFPRFLPPSPLTSCFPRFLPPPPRFLPPSPPPSFIAHSLAHARTHSPTQPPTPPLTHSLLASLPPTFPPSLPLSLPHTLQPSDQPSLPLPSLLPLSLPPNLLPYLPLPPSHPHSSSSLTPSLLLPPTFLPSLPRSPITPSLLRPLPLSLSLPPTFLPSFPRSPITPSLLRPLPHTHSLTPARSLPHSQTYCIPYCKSTTVPPIKPQSLFLSFSSIMAWVVLLSCFLFPLVLLPQCTSTGLIAVHLCTPFFPRSDFGFERKEIDQDCSGSAGENLDANLIPEVCEEGQYYNRSIGWAPANQQTSWKITNSTNKFNKESPNKQLSCWTWK